jgi:hypothetical protein
MKISVNIAKQKLNWVVKVGCALEIIVTDPFTKDFETRQGAPRSLV